MKTTNELITWLEHIHLPDWPDLVHAEEWKDIRHYLAAFDQIQWERDAAIEQLHNLGYELGSTKENSFPHVLGEECEMFVNDEWKRGKIIEGYRFNDGIVTIQTDDGEQYWCGEARTDLYRKVE